MMLILQTLNVLGLGGLAYFIFCVFQGLTEKLKTMRVLLEEQKDTLAAVRERADEFNRLSKGYKEAIEDWQAMGKLLKEQRQEVMQEMEDAIKKKDNDLVELRKVELKEIELKQKSYDAIPALEQRFTTAVAELESQIKILTSNKGLFVGASTRNLVSVRSHKNHVGVGRSILSELLANSERNSNISRWLTSGHERDLKSPKTSETSAQE